MKKFFVALSVIGICTVTTTSCLKGNYDAPPDLTEYDPMLTVTHTIAQLKALNGAFDYKAGGDTSIITQEVIIAGVVTANDRSGNFYKQLVIQDSSSAIMILLDANSLYNDYPVGRKIYVRCNGLWLGYDGGLPVLGYTPNEQVTPTAIPTARINDVIVKANIGNLVLADTVDLVTIKAAQDKYYNRLVCVREAQFVDITKSYTQPTASTSRDIEDCGGNKLVVRSSNYANFASLPLPRGKGSILGIYTVYVSSTSGNKTAQLVIRDTTDVKFSGSRCGGILNENFEGASTSGNLSIADWTNYAQTGNVYYTCATYSNNKFAKISAYGSNKDVVKSWLITPGINLSSVVNPKLTFKTIDGYDNGATLKVFVSTDYPGSGDPTTANWAQVNAVINSGHTSGYASIWLASGIINLSLFIGNVHVAFVYEGTDPSGTTGDKTTTFEIDDVVISGD